MNSRRGALYSALPHDVAEDSRLSKMPLIAIVDDDDSFRRATASFVRSLGYAVAAFASGEAFLRSDRLGDANCLITDVEMPGMTGLELQRQLIDQGHRLPVIFLTAFVNVARRQANRENTVALLDKPFNDQQLIGSLRKALADSAI
jgi:FixJ family two-component response regulator